MSTFVAYRDHPCPKLLMYRYIWLLKVGKHQHLRQNPSSPSNISVYFMEHLSILCQLISFLKVQSQMRRYGDKMRQAVHEKLRSGEPLKSCWYIGVSKCQLQIPIRGSVTAQLKHVGTNQHTNRKDVYTHFGCYTHVKCTDTDTTALQKCFQQDMKIRTKSPGGAVK